MSASPGVLPNDYSAQPPFLYVVDAPPAPLPLPALLEALAALGVTFRREGDALALKGASVLTADLRDACRVHKPELLALCDQARPASSVPALPPAGVLWHSDVLGEAIRLVPDGAATATDPDGRVVYTASEVRALKGISPGGLRFIHEVRKAFPGSVTE